MNLKKLLEAKGMKQAELARKMGVLPYEVNRWYLGKTNPTAKNIYKLSKVLGVDSVEELLGD